MRPEVGLTRLAHEVAFLFANMALGDRDMRTWVLAAGIVAVVGGTALATETLPRDIAVAWLVFMIAGELVFGWGLIMMFRQANRTAEKVYGLIQSQNTRIEQVRDEARAGRDALDDKVEELKLQVHGLNVEHNRFHKLGE